MHDHTTQSRASQDETATLREPTVLLVTDRPATVAGSGLRQMRRYEVRTAADRQTALEKLDDGVDVVLFDRRLPELSVHDVLAEIREHDIECRVVVLTDSGPSVDSVDGDVDAYLQTPVSRERLVATVEAMLRRTAYDTKLQEYFSLATRKSALEAEHDREALADHPEYRVLSDDLDRVGADLDEIVADLSPGEAYAVAVNSTPPHLDDDG